MILFWIVGEEYWQMTPPPRYWPPGQSKVPQPFVIVKPSRIESRVSLLLKAMTDPDRFPSMTVTSGPSWLLRVIALPLKLMFSTYVPGLTMIVSPGDAASIAPWIVATGYTYIITKFK